MIPLTKYLRWFRLAAILFSGSLSAQQDTVVTAEETAYFRKLVDSTPAWIASGKLIPNKRPCNLADHLEYGGNINGRAVSVTREALGLSGKQQDDYLLIQVLKDKAIKYYDKKNYPIAYRLYQRALDIAIDNDLTYEELHGLRPAINHGCFLSGDYELAMKISTEGLATAERINDDKQASHFNNVIGYIHMKQGNFAEAYKYYTQYLGYNRKIKDTLLEAHALLNMADLASAQKQYHRSLEYLKNALTYYGSIENSGSFRPAERRG